ncbi:hypothetical protein PL81_19230, partial [Streptomyces sp. RSD-27]
RTAVFRTVRPVAAAADSGTDRPADAKPGSGSGSAGSGKSAGGLRTTAFGVETSEPAPRDADARPGPTVRPASASGGADEASGEDRPASAAAGKPSAEPGAAKPSADSERTAVFRTVRPVAAAADSGTDRPADAKPGSGSGSAGSGKSAGGLRTTAFGVETSEPAPRDADARPGPTVRPASASGGADEASGEDRPASAAAGKPSAEPGAAKPSADSERTAVFRTVRPVAAAADSGTDRPADAKPGSGSGSAGSGKSAGGLRTTAFGVETSEPAPRDADARPGPTVRPASASGGADEASGEDRPASAAAGKPSAEPGAAKPSADSERTAVFRTVRPVAAAADSGTDRPADAKPGSGSGSAGSGKSAGGLRTTAFGVETSEPAPRDADARPGPTVRPASASGGADEASGEDRPASAAAGKPSAEPGAAKPSADSERTAVFRTVRPGSAAGEG